MKKRIISLFVTITMMVTFVPYFTAYAQTNIKIGDYIQMGHLYGKPILWRCVDIDSNGPLILSDKIISIQPFNHSSSSVLWSTSSIRTWLNNSFLKGFNDNELKVVKSVSQKTTLSKTDAHLRTSGSSILNYNIFIDNCVQNYNNAYAHITTDSFFLLDIKQLNTVYRYLGDYYRAYTTPEAISNAVVDVYYENIPLNEHWYYYLRTPHTDGYGFNIVRSVYRDDDSNGVGGGYIGASIPTKSQGIRPAFYLSDGVGFDFGEGSEDNPYKFGDISVSSVSMMSPSATIKVGDTHQAMAYCMPTTATDKTLTWSTNNPLVATVNNNGVVTAKGPGKATITAKSNNGKKASCIVTVTKQNVIDYDDFKYSFSNSHSSFGYSDSYKIPEERYMQLGDSKSVAKEKVKNSSKWGGNCFGMSNSSILFYKNILQEERYNTNVNKPKQFNAPNAGEQAFLLDKWEIKLRHMIELFQLSYGLPECTYKEFSASDIAKELDKGNPVSLFINGIKVSNGSGGGHEVVIYGYTLLNNVYTFKIYDCSDFVYELVYHNERNFEWGYNSHEYDWNTLVGYYTFDTLYNVYNILKSKGDNEITLFSLRHEPTYTYIFRPAENLTITNSLGQTSTISNGELLGEIDDAKLIPSSYLSEEPTYTIILPTDTYTIVGSGNEVITTSFADDYMSASVTAKSNTPITISSDLKEISVDTVIDEEYDITYTTYDNIFDEMTLSGTATGTVTAKLNDTDITIAGIDTLTVSSSVSDSVVSANSDSLSNSDEITVKCEENDSGATIQILSEDTELTSKTPLPERLTVATPVYSLASGTYTKGQTLNFTKDDETIIYYTTDGSIPSADNGIIYSLPIDINKSMTVKAISTKYGYLDSEIVELNYTLPEVDMPQANVESGEYDTVITVELSTGNYEDAIYYTLDGSSPLENGILYTVPINISEDAYLQAYTLRNGCISEISEYEYTVAPTYHFYFSNSLTNQDGEIITPDNIADVTKVKMTLSKLHTGDHTGVFLIAFYGTDNRLIYANYKTATISDDIDEVEIDITEDVSSAYKVKVFAWKDLSNIQPICEALEENIIIE